MRQYHCLLSEGVAKVLLFFESARELEKVFRLFKKMLSLFAYLNAFASNLLI